MSNLTGRDSNSEPNMQNIPMHTELGDKIREAMLPEIFRRDPNPPTKHISNRHHLMGRNGSLMFDSMCGACRAGEPYLD